jgi:FixJ family two-component response regulator
MNKEKHVYVVDDDPSVRIGIGRLLRAAGFNVRIFSNANEFIDFFNPSEFGCLILDVRMPGMSIEELVAEISQMSNAIPIIVITADDDKETRKTAQGINAVGFFRKPVDGPALLDAINWAFRSINKEDEMNEHNTKK